MTGETDSAENLTALGAHPHGTILRFPDDDDATNRAVADHQDTRTDWTYGSLDLATEVGKLRSWAHDLLDQFFSAQRAPEFLFRFEREGWRVLGHYRPGRNDTGLRWEISVNPQHLTDRSEQQTAAVLLHELLHWYEESVRQPRAKRNGYHSAWFRSFADDFGIPCTRYGAELGIVSPSRFTAWADERGLQADITSHVAASAISRDEALPKRVPWVCECPSGTLITVQVPRGSDLRAHCDGCHAPFQRKETR